MSSNQSLLYAITRNTYDNNDRPQLLPSIGFGEEDLHGAVALLVEEASEKLHAFDGHVAAREEKIVQIEHNEENSGSEHDVDHGVVASCRCTCDTFRLLETVGGHDHQ